METRAPPRFSLSSLRDRWIPLTTALVVAVAAYFVYQRIEQTIQDLLRDQLQAVLRSDVEALLLWVDQQRELAEEAASDARVRVPVGSLLSIEAKEAAPEALIDSEAQRALRQHLGPLVAQGGFNDFIVLSPSGQIIASLLPNEVGSRSLAEEPFIKNAFAGDASVSRPFLSKVPLPDQYGDSRPGRPTMLATAPVRGVEGQVIAVLGLRIRPEGDFTRILRVGRMGRSGETYAFDADGVMVSLSRFEDQLRDIGLLPKERDVKSMLRIFVRDPGVNLVAGEAPDPVATPPLTRAVKQAVQGREGFDTDGYRDYRGIPVIGAWTWIPEMEIGVTTEVDVEEAYESLLVVRRSFRILIGLLLVVAIANIFLSRRTAHLRQRVVEAERLGQYRLERKLGEGGMGTVYLARHALLQRPTAIKILNRDSTGAGGHERFEREVQVTSGLAHPNTIAIYDFGRTPDGVFYYAMEFLEGITLGRCIERGGSMPEGRVIHLLEQACGSLAEAHAAGLLHRDIKPANLMLCARGGLFDFLKVLDFGLVRPVQQPDNLGLTNVDSLTGTPLFLSPELIQAPESVDARSDVYQLGVVAYFLLTGDHVFHGSNVFEICAHHLYAEPEPPERRTGRKLAPDLSALVLRCLAKDREERPADASELLAGLRACLDRGTWSQDDARAWWMWWASEVEHGDGMESLGPGSLGTNPPTVVVDFGARAGRAR